MDATRAPRGRSPRGYPPRLNEVLGIQIEPWTLDYWHHLYEDAGLERYFEQTHRANIKTEAEVDAYINYLVRRRFPDEPELQAAGSARMAEFFHTFNENNRYLGFSVLVYRLRDEPEEPTLFD